MSCWNCITKRLVSPIKGNQFVSNFGSTPLCIRHPKVRYCVWYWSSRNGENLFSCCLGGNCFKAITVKRIVLTRPAVEAGENLGFLPGDLQEKVDPYLRPLYDSLYFMLGVEQVT